VKANFSQVSDGVAVRMGDPVAIIGDAAQVRGVLNLVGVEVIITPPCIFHS
jgi:hypothetical protein